LYAIRFLALVTITLIADAIRAAAG
jgi:hypothetical protein